MAHAGVPLSDAMVSGALAGMTAIAAKKHLDHVARLAIFFQQARRSVPRH